MKMATIRKQGAASDLATEYRSALCQSVRRTSEAALRRAYELGRRALTEKRSLVDVAAMHHQILGEMLADAPTAGRRQELLASAAAFLAEFVSPYEMAHRGVQDAIAGVRQVNERLEEEIKRIAYGVHDEAGQLLVAVHLAVADVSRALPECQRKELQRVEELLNQIGDQLRRYSHDLRPAVLDDLGWIPAIRSMASSIAKRAKLDIRIEVNVSGRLPGPFEIVLYRIAQEALNNIVKHAKASRVRIQARRQNDALCFSIIDNGEGFDVRALESNSKRRGLGLLAMQDRLHAIGGTLAIVSAPGRGTTLLARVPMEMRNASPNRTR
jgi:signal transduction histidine kinase